MKIYENVLIGNFIFSLGVQAGKKFDKSPFPQAIVSLFQQTPSDPYLGDLFTSFGGHNLLIEFKADSADKKEVEKIEMLTQELAKDNDLATLSTSCHFFAHGVIPEEAFNILFCPYLSTLNASNKTSLEPFISDVLNRRVGTNSDRFGEYVALLHRLFSNGKASSTGGLLLNVDANGAMTYLASPNLSDLLGNAQAYGAAQTSEVINDVYKPAAPTY